MHDLLRAHATADAIEGRRAALTRLFDHYRWAAAQAAAGYAPYEGSVRALVEDPGTECPPLGNRDLAKAWLDAERSNLIAVVRAAAELGDVADRIGKDPAIRGMILTGAGPRALTLNDRLRWVHRERA